MDWETIKTEYESSTTSIRDLAAKHQVKKSTLAWHAKHDNWQRPELSSVQRPTLPCPPSPPRVSQPPHVDDSSLTTLYRISRQELAQHLAMYGLNDLREHKLFADTLAQYAKVEEQLAKLNPPTPARPGDEIDYTQLADHELKEMQELMMKARILTD